MPLSRSQKEKIVSEAADLLQGAHMVIFGGFKKVSVAQSQTFRRKARKEGGSLLVAKKTLARLALKKAGLPVDALEDSKDALLIAAHPSADSALAKLCTSVAKELPDFAIFGGILDGQTMTREQVLELAKLPSR